MHITDIQYHSNQYKIWGDLHQLTHWGWVTHICISKLTIIGSDNSLVLVWRQAIIWTNAGILWIGPSGTNFSEMSSKIHTFSFKKMHMKMSSGKWPTFCLSLIMLNYDLCATFSIVPCVISCGSPTTFKSYFCFDWNKKTYSCHIISSNFIETHPYIIEFIHVNLIIIHTCAMPQMKPILLQITKVCVDRAIYFSFQIFIMWDISSTIHEIWK